MSQKLCAKSHMLGPTCLRLSLFGCFAIAVVAFGNTGCEDKAIGRPCDVFNGDAGLPAASAIYNPQALECPSRICIKPIAVKSGVNTTALCSAPCSQDSDCDGQARACNGNDSTCNDRRCMGGFACAIPFDVGPICCQKLCVCKDFYSQNITTPAACAGNGAATCYVPPPQ
jgi:hypothetical protein